MSQEASGISATLLHPVYKTRLLPVSITPSDFEARALAGGSQTLASLRASTLEEKHRSQSLWVPPRFKGKSSIEVITDVELGTHLDANQSLIFSQESLAALPSVSTGNRGCHYLPALKGPGAASGNPTSDVLKWEDLRHRDI